MSNRRNTSRGRGTRRWQQRSKLLSKKWAKLKDIRRDTIARETRHLASLEESYTKGVRVTLANREEIQVIRPNEYIAYHFRSARFKLLDLAATL